MPHNRIWTDPKAEAEFWQQMVALEALSGVGGASGLWGRFRRLFGQEDRADAIRRRAEDLMQRHTVLASDVVTPGIPNEAPNAALRTLAGLAVHLRQDRATENDEAARSA